MRGGVKQGLRVRCDAVSVMRKCEGGVGAAGMCKRGGVWRRYEGGSATGKG